MDYHRESCRIYYVIGWYGIIFQYAFFSALRKIKISSHLYFIKKLKECTRNTMAPCEGLTGRPLSSWEYAYETSPYFCMALTPGIDRSTITLKIKLTQKVIPTNLNAWNKWEKPNSIRNNWGIRIIKSFNGLFLDKQIWSNNYNNYKQYLNIHCSKYFLCICCSF